MDYEDSLMVKAAWYYYFENMTQQQIADLMGISRMRVIKILDQARSSGIIQFRLRKDGEARMNLEHNLIHRFHLKDAFIVPASLDPEGVNEGIAEAASMYISDRLSADSVINMGYGDTPGRVLNNLATLAEQPINCISLTGGVSYYLPDTRSHVFNAKLHLIPAPLLASTPEMAEALRQETSVLELSRMIRLAEFTVVGIGSMDPNATVFRAGILNQSDRLYLSMQGAVGDILSHFIDRKGQIIHSPIESRLISTELSTLAELKNVIGVAAGAGKVEAIRAALAGGYLDILITDDRTAQAVLDLPEEQAD